jgi:hypothetical protein
MRNEHGFVKSWVFKLSHLIWELVHWERDQIIPFFERLGFYEFGPVDWNFIFEATHAPFDY